MKKALTLLAGSIAFALIAPIACAEVSDKIPSYSRLWLEGAVLAVLGYLTARFTPWWSLVVVVCAASLLFANWDMFQDLAAEIRLEQGSHYEFAIWSSAALPLLTVGLGHVMRWRFSRKSRVGHDA